MTARRPWPAASPSMAGGRSIFSTFRRSVSPPVLRGRDPWDRSASIRPWSRARRSTSTGRGSSRNDAAGMRTITWSGGGAVDIYLDNDTSEAERHARIDREELRRRCRRASPAARSRSSRARCLRATTTSGSRARARRRRCGIHPATTRWKACRRCGSPAPRRKAAPTTSRPRSSATRWDMDSVADVDATAK